MGGRSRTKDQQSPSCRPAVEFSIHAVVSLSEPHHPPPRSRETHRSCATPSLRRRGGPRKAVCSLKFFAPTHDPDSADLFRLAVVRQRAEVLASLCLLVNSGEGIIYLPCASCH